MALSALDDKSKKPQADDLKKVLGRTSAHWNTLVKHIVSEYAPADGIWSFTGAKWGWAFRVAQKKRTVLYMTPCKGYFIVGFVLGERAVKAARKSALPDAVLKLIDEAKKYVEGRSIRIEVRSKKDLDSVKNLAAIKMAN